MKMTRLSLIALVLALGTSFSGCGKIGIGTSDEGAEISSEELGYEMEFNDCNTGKHTFDSKEALCKGLQDRTLNKGCAMRLRQDYHRERGCAGEFREF